MSGCRLYWRVGQQAREMRRSSRPCKSLSYTLVSPSRSELPKVRFDADTAVAGCPGSIVGAWMIQTKLGRRKSLAICTLLTSLSTFAFIRVEENWAVIVSSMVISAAATAMYAVLCTFNIHILVLGLLIVADGMTPETFGTSIRGTACGTSAALSRL